MPDKKSSYSQEVENNKKTNIRIFLWKLDMALCLYEALIILEILTALLGSFFKIIQSENNVFYKTKQNFERRNFNFKSKL